MAKFARVGYGSQGQGVGNNPEGYTYIVNDNVSVGDKIQVISTSYLGNKFATTAVPLSTHGMNTVKGREASISAMANGDHDLATFLKSSMPSSELVNMAKQSVTRSYTGSELGVSRAGMSKEEYQQAVRGGNLQRYTNEVGAMPMSQKAQEDFDSYSAKFMNKGEQE